MLRNDVYSRIFGTEHHYLARYFQQCIVSMTVATAETDSLPLRCRWCNYCSRVAPTLWITGRVPFSGYRYPKRLPRSNDAVFVNSRYTSYLVPLNDRITVQHNNA